MAATRPEHVARIAGGLVALVLALGALDALQRFRAVGDATSGVRDASGASPNVVLITIDTLRADRVLGGPAAVPTPALDALAGDGVVFTQARSAAPWTKPAMATLLTGLAPPVHGMTTRRARLPEEAETLAERLRAHGYRTAGIGLNAHLEHGFRFDQGFDDYRFPARDGLGIALGARVLALLAAERFPERFPTTPAIVDEACAWLQARADEPFFLWLHVLDPHWPYAPPPEWLADPERRPRSWGAPATVTAVQAGNTKPGADERARIAELYAAEIRHVDAEVGRFLARLRELGLYERSLVVLASDHGEELWEHGRYEHGHTLYDEVLRVPLVVKLPGASARARFDAPVTTAALVPTVLDVLGLPYAPATLAAASLAPFWEDPIEPRSEPHFATGTYYFGEKRAVVFDGWKLVLELDTGRVELFDLATDPHERVSLAAARPEVRERGLALVAGWEARCAEVRAELGIEPDEDELTGDTLHLLRSLGYDGAQ